MKSLNDSNNLWNVVEELETREEFGCFCFDCFILCFSFSCFKIAL